MTISRRRGAITSLHVGFPPCLTGHNGFLCVFLARSRPTGCLFIGSTSAFYGWAQRTNPPAPRYRIWTSKLEWLIRTGLRLRTFEPSRPTTTQIELSDFRHSKLTVMVRVNLPPGSPYSVQSTVVSPGLLPTLSKGSHFSREANFFYFRSFLSPIWRIRLFSFQYKTRLLIRPMI